MTELERISRKILMICNDMYIKDIPEHLTIDKVSKVIFDTLKEVVPDAKFTSAMHAKSYNFGYNYCREDMIQNRNKLTKEEVR